MLNVRVKFSKTGDLKYVSHLDLQRAVIRMILRSKLPVAYSEGFNPHAKLALSLPLSIYQESLCEFFDFTLTSDMSAEEIEKALSKQAFSGFEILQVFEPTCKLSSAKSVNVTMSFAKTIGVDELARLLSGEMIVDKRSKSGDKRVDISTNIKLCGVYETEQSICADIEMPYGDGYVNPSLILAFLGDRVECERILRTSINF